MLLSRVANSLYWMGRYLERSENATRHLLVASEFSVELGGISPELGLLEWKYLVDSLPSPQGLALQSDNATPVQYFHSYMLDLENQVSVISSISKARDNARSIGEILTQEVTTNLNQNYRRLFNDRNNLVLDPGRAHEYTEQTLFRILTTLGAIEQTLSRGQGWNYMKLGEAMERTQRALFILKSRMDLIQNRTEDELQHASYRSLLRSIASLENYRQVNGPVFDAERILKFVLFEREMPKTVHTGVMRMDIYLKGIPDAGAGVIHARKKIGKLLSRLEFDDVEIIHSESIVSFIDEALFTLFEVHELLCNSVQLA